MPLARCNKGKGWSAGGNRAKCYHDDEEGGSAKAKKKARTQQKAIKASQKK